MERKLYSFRWKTEILLCDRHLWLFGVLRASFNKLEVHYFDFSREYVQYIEIPFVFDYASEFMIYKNTIMDC